MIESANGFPPTDVAEIAAYDLTETVDGYSDDSDVAPGANRSPAYRWGWLNRKRDGSREDDGFDALRHAYFRARASGMGGFSRQRQP